MAEIALQQGQIPVDQPQDPGAVEAELFAQRGDFLRRGVRARHGMGGIARHDLHQQEGQQADKEQDRDCGQKPAEDVVRHDALPSLRGSQTGREAPAGSGGRSQPAGVAE